MKRVLPLSLVLLACASAHSANTGIRTAVAAVEAHFGVRHHGVPMLWLAKPFLFRSGVGGVRIAVFEDFRAEGETAIGEVVREALGSQWSLFVEVRSSHERTNIYVRPERGKMVMLIANLEGNELSLVQISCSDKALHHWVAQPVRSAREEKV